MRQLLYGTVLGSFIVLQGSVGLAQRITPASDGTGTQINRYGNRTDITGGQRAGRNLFHSFGQFNVDAGNIANFLAAPNLQNILARVTGGSASYINGVIQVTGGNPNLYLMNPAGIVFGQGASLNVPASFTATTADRIMFPGGSFNASGVNNYSQLAGEPIGFAFDRKDPAAIINEGKLSVNPGQSVSLVAGQVINTGTVQAPGGNITIAAVPGENLVRLSQTGQLLSLEFNPQQAAQMMDNQGNIPTTRLPELLTGGGVTTVTQNNNGTVSVAGANLQIPTTTGTTIVSGVLDVSSASQTGGNVGVFGTQIALANSEINASGFTGGGEILVGGEFQGKGTQPNAQYTFVSKDSKLTADAISSGNGGRVIVWADKATDFRGTITAKGGQNGGDGGFVEVSGKESLGFTGNVNTSAPQGKKGTLLLDPENIIVLGLVGADDAELPEIFFDDRPGETLTIGSSNLIAQLFLNDVILQATNNITFNADLVSTFGDTTLFADAGNTITVNNQISGSGLSLDFFAGNAINVNALISLSNGEVNLSAGSVSTQNIFATEGIFVDAGGSISTGNLQTSGADVILSSGSGFIDPGSLSFNFGGGGNIQTGNITTFGGDIEIATGGGTISTGILRSSASSSGDAGFIGLIAPGDIQTGFIQAEAPNGSGGDVFIISTNNVRIQGMSSFGFSISTAGGAGGGEIFILHGGQNFFTIGDASTNGTTGAITTGQFTLSPFQQFYTRFLGNISIVSLFDGGVGSDLFGTEFYGLDFDLGLDAIEDVEFDDLDFSRLDIAEALGAGDYAAILALDTLFGNEFSRFLGVNSVNDLNSVEAIGNMLSRLAQETGKKPAIIYLMVDEQQLSIAAVTPGSRTGVAGPGILKFDPGLFSSTQPLQYLAQQEAKIQPVVRGIPEAKRANLMPVVERFLTALKDPRQRTSDAYLKDAQQLYRWLVAPIESELQAQGINTLMFSMDGGLRLLPVAALHDGKQFLVEKYSTALIPSVNLIDTRYRNIRDTRVLAMGADTFTNQTPLPAVPTELKVILEEWPGQSFLNQEFTVQRLTQERLQGGYPIIHLATHADFAPGRLTNSYIEFGNSQRLNLPQVRELPLREPTPVELFTLSACRTSVGDVSSELGFAGLAVQSGVKSATASLWYVSDEGTLALMSEFYKNLRQAPIKAEALRQAQIAMLQGKVTIKGGELRGVRGGIPVPPAIAQRGDQILSHPYYWAAFTMIGSPW
ncbi:filamentous hemagglutinin family outer membrane protein, N-term part [Gloeomargarita lithophora Alchichica-D10]|uniref:Filamentous hemagglutinin family outer membrane protein, N-term part n=1 Tax=Gloeomargarita lithophora Alchichica-D10 TaxID=1188229 RepID=A0A1J0ABP7_9CYAN|nr:CHAT domain-containing protein [Gloeomargarita lithophora]APB33364.1 filamentous hemagglutinin family outer membrane protein, N-term part [Gloeomargarita lithophora Alchichica-D10]